jgi:glycosyltransferase involved in cell wall biosynthesis
LSPEPRRARVLLVVENLPVPADVRVWPEALALRDAGYQVAVVSPKGVGDHRAAYEELAGIHIYRYDLPTGNSPAAYFLEYSAALVHTLLLTFKIWRRHGFDVLHVANPPDIFFLLGLLFRPLGVKLIFDQHDLAPEVFESRFTDQSTGLLPRVLDRILRILEWCSYRVSDLVIVTNETYRRIAMERGGILPEKIAVVRNGPDLRRLHPVEPRPELRNRTTCLLGYVGTMAPQDGVEYAIRALDLLVHAHGRTDVCLVLVGDGAAFPDLVALTRKLRLTEHVTFIGRVPAQDVAPYLSSIDIGLAPEPSSGLNDSSTLIKVMEYMAMGKPVVAFDLPETRYSLQDAGLYAQPNSVEEFAARIEDLLDRADLRQELGHRGRRRIEESLAWEYSRRCLLDAYARLLG